MIHTVSMFSEQQGLGFMSFFDDDDKLLDVHVYDLTTEQIVGHIDPIAFTAMMANHEMYRNNIIASAVPCDYEEGDDDEADESVL